MAEAEVTVEMFAEIIMNKKEATGLHLLRLTKPAGFNHKPGQYIEVSLLENTHATFFAVCSNPADPWLDLLIRPAGENSKKICHLPTGTEVRVSGPLGPGFPLKDLENKIIYLIAHGTGISALKPVIEELRNNRAKYGPIRLLYGVRHHDEFPFRDLIREWMGSIEVYDIISKDPGDIRLWSGETGRVQDILLKIQPDPADAVALLSGSEAMEHQVTELLLEFGFSRDSIYRNH